MPILPLASGVILTSLYSPFLYKPRTISVSGYFARTGENSLTKVRFSPLILTRLSPACSPASSAGVTGIISFTTNGVLKFAKPSLEVISSSIKFSEMFTLTVSVPLNT